MDSCGREPGILTKKIDLDKWNLCGVSVRGFY